MLVRIALIPYLPERTNQTAIIWEGDDDPSQSRNVTYHELYEEICRFANGLKRLGVSKGHRVFVFTCP
ncbi:AMP-binding protein [Coxiella-like endosymbiont]|uniref:AMP-binding protein n=1 Tax=Coxiella-like endosymbiont TaxID=1592897 RepID=UPI0034E20685